MIALSQVQHQPLSLLWIPKAKERSRALIDLMRFLSYVEWPDASDPQRVC
jgi:hypothetical protein